MPSKWEMVRLGDVLEYEQPTKYIVENTNYDDGYKTPVLTAGQSFILGYTNETSNIFNELPVIIFDDFTTAIKYVDFPFKVKSSAMKILKSTKKAYIKYIYYYMNTIKADTQLHKRYWISKYADIQAPLPPLSVQQQIADVLDSIASLSSQRKQQLEQLDLLVKSRFVEMFGDVLRNDKGWITEKLETLCKISRGGSPRPIDKFLGGTIPWIKIGDATSGNDVYLHETKDFIIEEGIKKSRYIKSGSLIFANCGVSLGFARIITFEGCIHDGWLSFEDIDERLNKVFFLKSLNQCTNHFRMTAPDGTQPNLNTGIMKSFKQIIPPLTLQNQYIAFVEAADKSKFEIQQGLKKLELQYNALMQQYFG